MKTHLYRPILLAGVIGIVTIAASAQSIKATVPFRFKITNTEMPPGEYSVRQLEPGSSVILLNNWEAHKSVMLLSQGRLGDIVDRRPRLVFHCVENRCSLAEVWGAAPGGGIRVSPPKVRPEDDERLTVVYFQPKSPGR